MDVKEIVRKYLKDNGYDGLCGEDCGCDVDDLMPCEGDNGEFCDCVPGYFNPKTLRFQLNKPKSQSKEGE